MSENTSRVEIYDLGNEDIHLWRHGDWWYMLRACPGNYIRSAGMYPTRKAAILSADTAFEEIAKVMRQLEEVHK